MRRYLVGRRVREYRLAFRWKSLALRLILMGWKDSGYIFDGSSMMFKGVQSLVAGRVRKNKNPSAAPPQKGRHTGERHCSRA